ncbi:MAG: peptidoglycan-binding protein, partial [Micrococcales bacterium]|nr:peptidoglycan-binding protein [Micrococcales bacterium]
MSSSVLARRRRVAWTVVAVALLLAFGCGMALQYVRSPAQAALDAAAPPRTILSAKVTTQVVSASVVGRGTVTASAPVTVPLPPAPDGGRQVVSAAPIAVGGTVNGGDVVAAVSGRPVIALPGPITAYRDLRPGDQGDDVAQLQRAVNSLGRHVTVDGVFGDDTKVAVRWLYQRAGYQVPSTTGLGEPPDPGITAAQTAVLQAERQVDALRQAPDTPSDLAGTSQVTLSQAITDLNAARAALAQARSVSGQILPMAEVAYAPTLPARLASLSAPVGATPADPLAVLDTGDLIVAVPMEPTVAAGVHEQMSVV